MRNVDSLHILSDRPWGASRKMLRSPRRAQVLSERQRVSNHRELRLLAYPWLDAGNGRLLGKRMDGAALVRVRAAHP